MTHSRIPTLIRYLTLPLILLSNTALCAENAAQNNDVLATSADAVTESKLEIDIWVVPAVLTDLPAFLGDQSIDDIKNFNRPNSRRDLVDYILLRQALTLGLQEPINIRITPWLGDSYNRMLSNLNLGKFSIFSNTVWREDFTNNSKGLYISSPVLAYGELEAGVYMNPNNPKYVQALSEPLDLTQLSAVTSKQWKPDYKALKSLPLKQLYDEVNWEHMLKMVHNQRADFMLVPFSATEGMSYSALNITLLPVPNVKVALHGSRGWAISEHHRYGAQLQKAIERGLAILRKRQVIPRAYIEAGVINSTVKNWATLNSLQGSSKIDQKPEGGPS